MGECRKYIYPSKAGLHAAAHANAEVHLSTSEHQHDAASGVLRAALRNVVTRCAAAPSARTAVLHNLSQLDRLAPGSKIEARRDRLVPRMRGDIHPDLTAAVASIVLPDHSSRTSSGSILMHTVNPPVLQERSDSLSTDSGLLAGAFSSRSRPGGSACSAGPIASTGSSAAQIEHMRRCKMCSFAAKHFHGERLVVQSDAACMYTPGAELTGAHAGGPAAGVKDIFQSATDEPTQESEEDECVVSEASAVSQQPDRHAHGGMGGSRTAWSVPEDSTVSHSCVRVQSGDSSAARSEEDLPASSLMRVATGAFSRTPKTPGKTLTVMKGMLHGSRSREILARAEGSGTSLHAWSRSLSITSRSSGGRMSSHGNLQRVADKSEAQRRWAFLARHTRLMALEQELRRSMWEAAVTAATAEAERAKAKAAAAAAVMAAAAASAKLDRSDLWRAFGACTSNPLYESPPSVTAAAPTAIADDSHSIELPAAQDAAAPLQACRNLAVDTVPELARPGGLSSMAWNVGPTAGCRKLNLESLGALGGPGGGRSSVLDDECSGVFGDASTGLFGEVSMMGGASILE